MGALERIERSLDEALARSAAPGCPPRLAAAMRHAVFPRGARVRPRLCLAVAEASGDGDPALAEAAAAAIELLHCASLVHDDLPCFDDADMRRGRSSVHRAFGEPLAVLAGDALIVLAFQRVAECAEAPEKMAEVLRIVAGAVGAPSGIVAGQAWECEAGPELGLYQRQKTGALFVAATTAGAAAAGARPESWRALGEAIGEAYQVADDLRDVLAGPEEIGKPAGRDAALGRPSAVAEFGVEGAVKKVERLIVRAVAAIPPCPGESALRTLVLNEAIRLRPKQLALQPA